MHSVVRHGCALLLMAAPFTAHAAFMNFLATLDSDQATTVVMPSNGSGSAGVVLNAGSGELSWNIAFEGLNAPATAIHFHGPAPPGQSAGIALDIAGNSVLSGTGSTEGLYLGAATIGASQAQDLRQGLWYVNIHTSDNPGGEIRGQVLMATPKVPLPGAAVLLLSALAVSGALARRRRPALRGWEPGQGG